MDGEIHDLQMRCEMRVKYVEENKIEIPGKEQFNESCIQLKFTFVLLEDIRKFLYQNI